MNAPTPPAGQAFVDQVHRQALRVLERIGLTVENEPALLLLAGQPGLRIEGSQVRFDPRLVEEQVTQNRAALRELKAREGSAADRSSGATAPSWQISIGCGDMPQHYRCPRSRETALFTAGTLVQATRFLEACAGSGSWGMVPGVPRDVPPQLQAVTEYAIGCEWSSRGGNVDTLHPPQALPYLFEMAAAMGREIRDCGIFSVSPLRLGGFELETAIRLRDRFDAYSIASLPAAGASGPVYPRVNWAVSVAEVLGGAVVLRLAGGGKPVHLGPGMYPFDMRSLAVIGGSPENVLMQHAAFELARHYDPGASYVHTITTQARHPGLQAGLEKSMGAGYAAALGCRDLQGGGMLGFDDVFSPEQYLADRELRDSLQALVRPEPAVPEESWLALVIEGVAPAGEILGARGGAAPGFVPADTTLDHWGEVYHTPRLLDRSTMYGARGPTAEAAVRDEAVSLLEMPSWTPPEPAIGRVREIFGAAWQELAGTNPPAIRNDGKRA